VEAFLKHPLTELTHADTQRLQKVLTAAGNGEDIHHLLAQVDNPPIVTLRKRLADNLAEGPQAVQKAVANVTASREAWTAALAELSKRMSAIQDGGAPDWDAENDVLRVFLERVIPELRLRRSEILRSRGEIEGSQVGYLQALEDAIRVLQEGNLAGAASDKVKSQKVLEQLRSLDAVGQSTATAYAERLKEAQIVARDVESFLQFVEDSELLLNRWHAIITAMIESGEQGQEVMAQVQMLRQFAEDFELAITRFAEFANKLQTGTIQVPPPAAKPAS
jgi:hypothetical protein